MVPRLRQHPTGARRRRCRLSPDAYVAARLISARKCPSTVQALTMTRAEQLAGKGDGRLPHSAGYRLIGLRDVPTRPVPGLISIAPGDAVPQSLGAAR